MSSSEPSAPEAFASMIDSPKAKWQTCHPMVLCSIGGLAGLVLGTLGVGGGIVMIPFLTLLLGCDRIRAVAASLATIAVFSLLLVSADALHHPEHIRVSVAAAMVIGALMGVKLGTAIATRMPDKLFAILFILLLLAGAGKQAGLSSSGQEFHVFGDQVSLAPSIAIEYAGVLFALILAGAIGGLGASVLGIGGGVVYVTAMTLMHADFSNPLTARATSLAIVLATSIYATLLNRKRGRIEGRLATWLITGGVVGAVCGHVVASEVPKELLGKLLAGFLLANALIMIRRQFFVRASKRIVAGECEVEAKLARNDHAL